MTPPSNIHETLSLSAETTNVPVARRFVRSALARYRDDDGLVKDLELMSSELVTNAIEHGGGDEVDVIVACDGDRVHLSVTSRGNLDQVDPAATWTVADVDSLTGRGLGIVRALADRVNVSREAGALTITVERAVT